MSVKRQATTELNRDNWDQEDPAEKMGSFTIASKDVLEKRVIRTAKRRSQLSGDETKKSVFSGFSGFNKPQPSSFDFLTNLTNGNKTIVNSPSDKNESEASSSLFNSKPVTSNLVGSSFTVPVTSSSVKSTFESPSTQTNSLFGGSTTNNLSPSIFNASKTEMTGNNSVFKNQITANSSFGSDFMTQSTNTISMSKSSAIFGATSTNVSSSKSLFSTTTVNSTPFKIQPLSSTTLSAESAFNITTKAISSPTENKAEATSDDKKLKYYAKLKGLNESVSDWIKKHVEETPLCILSPIFKDYEKYLKEIQDEYQGTEGKEKPKDGVSNNKHKQDLRPPGNTTTNVDALPLSDKKIDVTDKDDTKFNSIQNNVSLAEKSSNFSFGINTVASTSVTTTTSAGFSFGITTTPQSTFATNTSPFSFATNTTNASGAAPFSFGIGKPFSLKSSVVQKSEPTNDSNENEDEPPKVEFTPVVEENSVYEKRCKVFVKKDNNFVDKGVGTLYVKEIKESGKHQLLVRANTNLGTILLNLLLTSAIPIKRMGKNNVMMVCIPTPETKPPPTSILIRVKTSEEADELLETLNKYSVEK